MTMARYRIVAAVVGGDRYAAAGESCRDIRGRPPEPMERLW
jgi:hypothetical protein